MTDSMRHRVFAAFLCGVVVVALAWAWARVQRATAAAYSAGQVDGVRSYVRAYRGTDEADRGA